MKHLLSVTSIMLMLAGIALSGCTVKTTVQATATTPANVTHLYVTVKELWFSSDANATPDDDRWVKKVLPTPATIDLAALNNGTPGTIGTISLSGISYSQLRLVLADAAETLAKSASDLGLSYNNVVQYVDASGASHVVPLEWATPDSSLLIPISIKLNAIGVSPPLAATSTDTTSITANNSSTSFGGSGASVGSTQATATITLDVDALRGLTIFNDGTPISALLNPGLHAYDDSQSGTINGTFDLAAVPVDVLDNAQGIIVTAEAPSSDGTHYTVVKNTRMDSDGSFTLYPLPVNKEAGSSTYDLVVHGPGIQTIVIAGVTVNNGETTTVQSSDITLPVAASFVVNTSSAVPGGTQAAFYQTLPSNALPYAIETGAVNPFGSGFGLDIGLASSAIVAGAYNDGDLISFASVTPQEGAATYQVVSNSPWRAISNFGTVVNGATSGSSVTQSITVPQPNLPAGAVARAITGTLSFSSPGQFDSLYVLISRGGQLVEVLNLSASLSGQTTLNFTTSNIPGGTPNAVYDVAVRAWHSGNAATTLARKAFATRADLRSTDATGLNLQL